MEKSRKPKTFWDMGNPILQMMLETDAPSSLFQPMKAMALGQIHTMTLINRRMQALSTFSHQVMTCKSPQQLAEAQMRFIQTAWRDYSDAVQSMSAAWDQAIETQVGADQDLSKAPPSHDYMSLPSASRSDVNGSAVPDQGTGNAVGTGSAPGGRGGRRFSASSSANGSGK